MKFNATAVTFYVGLSLSFFLSPREFGLGADSRPLLRTLYKQCKNRHYKSTQLELMLYLGSHSTSENLQEFILSITHDLRDRTW